MRGLRRRAGTSSPRNPQPRNLQPRDLRADPDVVRQRTRSSGRPITPHGLGL